jgi:hypothetical protein
MYAVATDRKRQHLSQMDPGDTCDRRKAMSAEGSMSDHLICDRLRDGDTSHEGGEGDGDDFDEADT